MVKKNNFHRPIGASETQKGLSLSVADLLRKTSAQNLADLKLNSRLKDMFESGLTDIQEERLLDFVPLQQSAIRDLTDLQAAHDAAREYVREQFEAWERSKAAAERRRAQIARAQSLLSAQPAADESLNTPRSSVETSNPAPLVQ